MVPNNEEAANYLKETVEILGKLAGGALVEGAQRGAAQQAALRSGAGAAPSEAAGARARSRSPKRDPETPAKTQ
eukprot:14684426-Alexandrium_andersonii.AAC.1